MKAHPNTEKRNNAKENNAKNKKSANIFFLKASLKIAQYKNQKKNR